MYITEVRERDSEAELLDMTRLKSKELVDYTLYLQIGDVSCALVCPDADIYYSLRSVYQGFETRQAPDITIQLEPTDRLPLEKLEKSVFKSRFLPWQAKSFRTTQRIMSGRYDAAERIIKIKGERNLVNPQVKVNHLNRLFSLAYYTACTFKYDNVPPAMLVHSCTVLRNGRGILFTGPSGTGKTTVARLCGERDGQVINDEMIMLTRPAPGKGGVTIRSAPMLGTFLPQQQISAPLNCIFLLKQSGVTRARLLDKTEAYIRFLRQIIAPACIGQKNKKTIYSIMADFSAQITAEVPVFEMEFTLDGDSLWKTVEDVERSLHTKEGR